MGAPIELVIFDCDGVLVDSEPISVRIDMLVLDRVGLRMSRAEVIDRFVGRSPAVIREAIEEHLGEPLSPILEQEFEQLYADAFDRELTAVEGVHDALAGISLPTCVASSSEPHSLRHKLELVGLYELFAGRIFSATEVQHGKPAPDLFLHAAERMSTAPEACLVIEDSQYGVQAARAAGMDVFAYDSGLVDARLLAGERTVVFDDMRTLPLMLERKAAAAVTHRDPPSALQHRVSATEPESLSKNGSVTHDESDSGVFRRAGISYLRIPAPDPQGTAAFYQSVFEWTVDSTRPDPSFEDGTGHVIGHFIPDLPVAGEAGVRPYIYVASVDETLERVSSQGGTVVEPPYPEGDLWVATFRDPAGNVLGVWQRGPRD